MYNVLGKITYDIQYSKHVKVYYNYYKDMPRVPTNIQTRKKYKHRIIRKYKWKGIRIWTKYYPHLGLAEEFLILK